MSDVDSDEDECEDICSYLGQRRTDPEEVISMGRRVMSDQPVSSGYHLAPCEPEDERESSSDEEGLYREFSCICLSSLPVYCEFHKQF